MWTIDVHKVLTQSVSLSNIPSAWGHQTYLMVWEIHQTCLMIVSAYLSNV